MFEEMTYQNLLKRILKRVSDDIDKRQGSVIYDAVAPVCAELTQMYIELDNILKLTFAETSYGEYLNKRTSEMGIERRKATKAQRTAKFYDNNGESFNISIGHRFNIEDLNYICIEKTKDGIFILECESSGIIGNQLYGNLIPIENINGLAKAEMIGNDSIKVPGENEESDKELLERYRKYITNKVQDGNIAQYESWCDNENGIGAYKVIPLWNGANTVKVSICNSEARMANTELIESFQNKLDPEAKGLGNGLAPIGAIVTVSTGAEIYISINCSIAILDGYDFNEVYQNIEDKIFEYFKTIVYKKTKISYLQMASVISSINGIDTLTSLNICGMTKDVDISGERIPILRSKRKGDEHNDLTVLISNERV